MKKVCALVLLLGAAAAGRLPAADALVTITPCLRQSSAVPVRVGCTIENVLSP